MVVKALFATVALTAVAAFVGLDKAEEPEAEPAFRLLAFQLASDSQPVVVDGVELTRSIRRKDSVAFAWVDLGRYEPKKLNEALKPGEVLFTLVSDNGGKCCVEANLVPKIKSTNVACIDFLPGTGGDFVAPTLVATIDGRRVAEWKLPDYPTDKRVIPENESNVTQIDNILGLTIKSNAEARVLKDPTNRSTGFVMLWIDVSGHFDPAYTYWVSYDVPETTWRKEPYWGPMASLFTEPRRTGAGQAMESAAFADRMRVAGAVEIKRDYEEPVAFSGIEIVKDREGALWIVNRTERRARLSTGVEVVMPVFERRVSPGQDGRLSVTVVLEFPGGTKDLFLPRALDALGSVERINLSLGNFLANRTWTDAGGGRSQHGWSLTALVDPATVVPGTTFGASIGIKHEVTVAKQEYNLLIPLERKQ